MSTSPHDLYLSRPDGVISGPVIAEMLEWDVEINTSVFSLGKDFHNGIPKCLLHPVARVLLKGQVSSWDGGKKQFVIFYTVLLYQYFYTRNVFECVRRYVLHLIANKQILLFELNT